MNREVITMLTRTRFFQWLLLWVVLAVAGSAILLGPVRYGIEMNRKRVEQLRKMVSETERTSNLQDLDQLIKQKQSQLELLRKKTLRPGEQSKVIGLLTHLMEENGVVLIEIQPASQDPKTMEALKDSPVKPSFFNMEMECGYRNFGMLLEKLEADPLEVTIDRLEVQTHEINDDALTIKMQIGVYEEPLTP